MPKTQKKSTKKFEKKHLKDALERRKGFAKIKQRHQKKEKKRARREKENIANGESEDTADGQKAKNVRSASEAFKSMTMDDFFTGGYDLPEIKSKTTSKRKREPEPAEDDIDFSSNDSADLDRVQSDSEDGEQSDHEQDGHKSDLAALAKKDPEFYKYLQENDAELLDFDDNSLEVLSEENEEETRPRKKQKGSDKVPSKNIVTLAMISKWEDSMKTLHSTKAMREVVVAFRAAVHTDEDSTKTFKYTVSSSEVYHQVLIVAMRQIPVVLQHHLPVKETASGKVRVPSETKKFQTLAPLVMVFASSLLHLLKGLSDDSTIKATLGILQELLPYLLSFKKLIKNLLKTVTDIWSETGTSDIIRLNAFLIIRKLATIGDSSIKENLLKTAYQGLVQGSRNTTQHTLSGINLMKNSAVDLWGCDAALAYTTGFAYIRQLAVHLRNTLNKPTKDSYKVIYNWQYVHSLDFWSRTLSTHCSPMANPLLKKPPESPLFPLIYPLVQVTLGALRLIPTPTYFPLRFHLVRALLRISRATNTYIPLVPALMEILQSPEVRDPPKASTIKPIDFATTLRAAKQYSKTRVYQDGIIEQVSELLAEFFGIWAKSVAFPELIIPPVVLLKRWMKDIANPQTNGSSKKKIKRSRNRNPKLISSMTLLIQKLNLNAEFIQQHRRKLEFAPKDREQLDNFLKDVALEDTPMGGFVAAMRARQEEQRRLIDESRRQDEEAKRKREKLEDDVRMVANDDEDDSEADEVEEEYEDLVEEDEDDSMDGFIDDEAEEDDEEEEEEEEEDSG